MNALRRSPARLAIVVVVAIAILGAAGGLAYLFLRDTPPPPVGASAAPGATPAAQASVPGGPGGGTAAPGPISGGGSGSSWTIDTSIGSFSDFSSSFVGYRVDETLAGNKANTAVGRTPAVSGSLTLENATVTSVEIAADLTQLESDDSRRDGQLSRQAIETSRFPTATFTLTQPIELGSVPADGSAYDVQATGDLTLHGVTRTVTVPLHAQVTGDVVTITGSIDIVFADFSIIPPTSFVVLSIEDHGIMELQLHFRRG